MAFLECCKDFRGESQLPWLVVSPSCWGNFSSTSSQLLHEVGQLGLLYVHAYTQHVNTFQAEKQGREKIGACSAWEPRVITSLRRREVPEVS